MSAEVTLILCLALIIVVSIVLYRIETLAEESAESRLTAKIAVDDNRKKDQIIEYANLEAGRNQEQIDKMVKKLSDHSLNDDEWVELYKDTSKIDAIHTDPTVVGESTPKKS